MAKAKGKSFLIQKDDGASGYTTIAGLRSNSLSLNGETVDVTTKDDSNWRQLLDGAGILSVSLSGSGVFSDSATLKEAIQELIAQLAKPMKVISDVGDIFTGNFRWVSIERNGEYNGDEQYSISLESAAAVTFTPAP